MSMREELDIVAAYQLVGTYRGAAEICGTTHKTVKRVIERTRRHRPAEGASPANYAGSDRSFRRLVAKESGRSAASTAMAGGQRCGPRASTSRSTGA